MHNPIRAPQQPAKTAPQRSEARSANVSQEQQADHSPGENQSVLSGAHFDLRKVPLFPPDMPNNPDGASARIVQRRALPSMPARQPRETTSDQETQQPASGLPGRLRLGIEHLSGIAMDDVQVHYQSNLPARVRAAAYTRGADIYVGPGQERHLPHEAWHVVQQKQRRVPRMDLEAGLPINTDRALEGEAESMGNRALGARGDQQAIPESVKIASSAGIVQMARLITVPAEDEEEALFDVDDEQEPEEKTVDYVLVDVPGDGSCQMSSFNLGRLASEMLHNIQQDYHEGTLTPNDVERLVKGAFEDGNQEMNASPEQQQSAAPKAANNTMFDPGNFQLRHEIVSHWQDNHDEYAPKLKADIQGIVWEMLNNLGLTRNRRDDQDQKPHASSQDWEWEDPEQIRDDPQQEADNPIDPDALRLGEDEEQGQYFDDEDMENAGQQSPHFEDYEAFSLKNDEEFDLENDEENEGLDVESDDENASPLKKLKEEGSAFGTHAFSSYGKSAEEDLPSASKQPAAYVPVPDEDFIYNALYHPSRWRAFGGSSAQGKGANQYRLNAFGVDPAELLTAHIPHGVAEDGELAQGIRELVQGFALPHQVQEGFIPLGTVIAPTVHDIDDELVEKYIQEFEVNLHLWGTEASLQAASECRDTAVVVHSFDEIGKRVAHEQHHEGQQGPVHFYEAGPQSHFQILIGPFKTGFLLTKAALKPQHDEEESSSADEDHPIPELAQYAPELEMPRGLPISGQEDEEELRTLRKHWFLNSLADALGEDISLDTYDDLLDRLLHAAQASGKTFENVDQAAIIVQSYETQHNDDDEMLPEGAEMLPDSEEASSDDDEHPIPELAQYAPELEMPRGLPISGQEDEEELRTLRKHWFLNSLAEELGEDISLDTYDDLLDRLLHAAQASGKTFENVDQAAVIVQSYEAQRNDDEMAPEDETHAPQTEEPEKQQLLEDQSFLDAVGKALGKSGASANAGSALRRLFRAIAMKGSNFDSPEAAAALILEYEQEQREKRKQQERPSNPPIIPMSGFVDELFHKYQIPLSEIFELLPHVQQYTEFHKKQSSWGEEEAGSRVEALKNIAKLLNAWAEKYQHPDLHRGPSTAEFDSRPSLVPGEREGTQMRSLLTIDPGNLVGYEPAEYASWMQFNKELPGYVRAHLLNKHVGGPGIPENLAFLSSNDNLKMSRLGEEDVKRMVLEENKQVFFKVGMPTGMDVIHEAAHVDKALTDAMVREVQMFATEITPTTEDGISGFQQGDDMLRAKLKLGESAVKANPAGGITMKAQAPDYETIGKLQPHWRKRLKEKEEQAKQPSLSLYMTQDESKTIELAARKALMRADIHEKEDIIKQVWEDLEDAGIDEETRKEIIARLHTHWRTAHMPKKARTKGIQKHTKELPKKQAAVKKALAEKGIKVSTDQIDGLCTLGKETFKKYVQFRVEGLSHSEALRSSKTRKNSKRYNQAKQGASNQQTGQGIHRYF